MHNDKNRARKPLAALLSLAVLLPSFLGPVGLYAQSDEAAAPRTSLESSIGGETLDSSVQELPSDLNQTLPLNSQDTYVPLDSSKAGADLGAAAIEDQASLATQPRAQASPSLRTNIKRASAQTSLAAQRRAAVASQISTVDKTVLPTSSVEATTPETAGQIAARQSRALAPPAKASDSSSSFAGLATRVRGLIKQGRSLFDGSDIGSSVLGRPSALSFGIIRPEKPPTLKLPRGVKVTKKTAPRNVEQGAPVSVNKLFSLSQAPILNADPKDMASVEKAVRTFVDTNPSQYGAGSQDMWPTAVELLPGTGKQADSIIAVFRQYKEGKDIDGKKDYRLAVEGANLRFHLKVLNGQVKILAIEGGFVPGIDTSVMAVHYTDEQMAQIAAQQIGSQEKANKAKKTRGTKRQSIVRRAAAKKKTDSSIVFLTRQLVYINETTGWRAMNIYEGGDLSGNPVIVLVDVNSGQAYAVNPQDMRYGGLNGRRHTLRKASKTSTDISGIAQARGTTLGVNGEDRGPLGPLPLANAYVYDDAGKVVATTDDNGAFTIPAGTNGGKPMRVTVKLEGIYYKVVDDDSKDIPLAATVVATPGKPVTLPLNATGDDEQLDAVVNSYVYPALELDFMKSKMDLGGDSRFFVPLRGGVHANGTAMVGNADYDPTVDGFFSYKRGSIQEPMAQAKRHSKASTTSNVMENTAQSAIVSREFARRQTQEASKANRNRAEISFVVRGKSKTQMITLVAENTAEASIILHEFGHRQFQIASQLLMSAAQASDPANRFITWIIDTIIASESNEAGADTFSMFIRNSPILGNGFILSADPASAMPNPNIIRTGENKTPYDVSDDPNDDPHQQGETQMGTAWATYQDLIKEMGQAEALKYAAKLFIRTWLYVQPSNVASALTHALLADMNQDGTTPHEAIIRGHAQNDHGLTLPSPTDQHKKPKRKPKPHPKPKRQTKTKSKPQSKTKGKSKTKKERS